MSHDEHLVLASAVLATMIAVAPAPAVADLVDAANSIRLQGCGARSGGHAPLRAQAKLDEAAHRLSRGGTLPEAVSGAGYRAAKSSSIQVRTTGGDAAIARILEQRFCDLLSDSAFQEIGIARRGGELWMVLAAPSSPPSPGDAVAVSRRVLELVNQARAQARQCGGKTLAATRPLQLVAALGRAALAHAQDMAARNTLGHKGHDGTTPADRVTREGYRWRSVAENVAAGPATAEEAVNEWLVSPGHCANLMDARFTEMGVAYALAPAGEAGIYWAQVFAAPRSAAAD